MKADQGIGRFTFRRLSTVYRNELGIDVGLIQTAASSMTSHGLF